MSAPCPYCARYLADVARLGCGSQEFPQALADDWCEVYQTLRRKMQGPTNAKIDARPVFRAAG